MTAPRYAALAARLLRWTEHSHLATDEDRDRGLATIARALGARRKRQGRRLFFGVAAAAVAAWVIGWVSVERRALSGGPVVAPQLLSIVASPIGDGASFLDSTGEVPLGSDVTLRVGGRIATGRGGGAQLRISTGTQLDLEAVSTLTLQNQDKLQRFSLAQGVLEAKVAKLGHSERFVIDTPDAQVEVRGTAFRLEVLPAAQLCGDGTRTRLDVAEGIVEVRTGARFARIGAGQHWPPDCSPTAPVPGLPVPAPSPPSSGVAIAVPHASPAARAKPRHAPRSLIAVQNELFERGVRAQQLGDTATALGAYADLIERYPASPLVENARVGRMRLLEASDKLRARQEAARYLERHAHGFARVEAQRIVDSP